MDINLDQFKNLDLDNIGDWPGAVKGFFAVLVFAIVIGLVYYVHTTEQIKQLEKEQRTEQELRTEFETKQLKAVNLQAYRDQMLEMCNSFQGMLRQLPTNTEIPGLIDDISQSEAYSGLEFKETKYLKEKKAEFYTEKPVQIQVTGDYHQLGMFVSRVSSLPRIVTMHNLTISVPKVRQRQQNAQSGTNLTLNVLAITYRYDASSDDNVCDTIRANQGNKGGAQ